MQQRRGVSRFLNNSQEARRRRGKRNAARKRRMATPGRSRDTRAGARRGCLPCCGKRPGRCKCWGAEAPEENRRLVQSLNRKALNRVIRHVAQADIVTFRDTADMPEYLLQCPRDHQEDMAYRWRIAFLWRSFSNPILWQALVGSGAVTPAREPNWLKMKTVCETFQKNELPLNGGLFRHTTLKHYRTTLNGKWLPAPKGNAARQVLSCRLAWQAMPTDAVQTYAENPCRDTFRKALHGFQAALSGKHGLTSGKYSDYSFKCMLDALLCDGSVSPRDVGTWPMGCPAYRRKLPQLFPGLPRNMFFMAACYYRSLIYRKHGFNIADSLAQLCWVHRAAD